MSDWIILDARGLTLGMVSGDAAKTSEEARRYWNSRNPSAAGHATEAYRKDEEDESAAESR